MWYCRQGWLAWTVSGAAGYLGYVPLHDAPLHQDMQGDESTFQSVIEQLDLRAFSVEGSATASALSVHATLKVTSLHYAGLHLARIDKLLQ